ncbi:hypothetical protein [Sphingosinicella rhizophila]|uniref:Uncharacterized protein n=1 Tax=Sphingosinicella rhizophila TaxID=3050082 RepID=A0ABU3Q6J0_9SPHN|nr:hypothetical protein [Sphingosinicella sp. GR2756]MDT9599021.1 hypothetical protein [Sphingosinicella sp. GR2756]
MTDASSKARSDSRSASFNVEKGHAMLTFSLHLRRAAAVAAAATLLLGFTAPASAGEATDANASAAKGNPTGAKPAPTKKYCFLFETTGSRMRSKVCKTRAEWEAQGQPIEEK